MPILLVFGYQALPFLNLSLGKGPLNQGKNLGPVRAKIEIVEH